MAVAAELKRGGPVVYEECDPGGPNVVDPVLIAERRAELETLAQAGTSAVRGRSRRRSRRRRASLLAMSAGSPICRASVSASRASGTALGASPASR